MMVFRGEFNHRELETAQELLEELLWSDKDVDYVASKVSKMEDKFRQQLYKASKQLSDLCWQEIKRRREK